MNQVFRAGPPPALKALCMLMCALCMTAASAQTEPVAGVYTCVDASGRKLTADRPIPECLDREQKVLNPSGTVRKKIGPALSPVERAQQEALERKELEARNRVLEDRRRDRALLLRYPTKALHDQERAAALAKVDVGTQAAQLRMEELQDQRKRLDAEMEFYKKDPSKAPAHLRRRSEDNEQAIAQQQHLLSEQANEVRRVNLHFDDELVRLRQLWIGK
jgi:Domain of unknown function (DUF4124)